MQSMFNWKKLNRPIAGMAPMDGITDNAFRIMTDSIGKPGVLFTEFVPVDAIKRGAVAVLRSFQRHETETPVIAQLFGSDPESFYSAAFVPAALGFDGVDINMGCPDRTVMRKGGGGSLIGDGDRAYAIITAVRRAMADFASGRSLDSVGLPEAVVSTVNSLTNSRFCRRALPVSVKTRIGKDVPMTETWLRALVKAVPDSISVHGRTLRQLYTGKADWEQVAIAAHIARESGIICLGNGDITSMEDGEYKCQTYRCDGFLVGRNALGNPWFFARRTPTPQERKDAILEHCRLFLSFRPDLSLLPMRKHLAWYCKGFTGYKRIREAMMKVTTMEDLHHVLLLFKPQS